MSVKQLNYHHLYYFYVVAREGSITKAANVINISSQTISGQIISLEQYVGHDLFTREGKKLRLNERGKLVYSYAQDIFMLGDELGKVIGLEDIGRHLNFSVGIVDVVPKVLGFDLVKQSLGGDTPVHLVTRSGNFETLLAEMATGKLDLVISDRALPQPSSVKAYSHLLVDSETTFFISQGIVRQQKTTLKALTKQFPQCLNALPLVIPGDKSVIKHQLLSWFESTDVYPNIVAEFDDTLIMKFFGQADYGVFCAPSIIEPVVLEQFNVKVLARTSKIKEAFYAISPERKIKHPAVERIFSEAQLLMGKGAYK